MTDAAYEYFTHGDNKIQVDSAIRDGDGYRIATTYPKKIDIRARPAGNKHLVISHGLANAPVAVSLYVVHPPENPAGLETLEKIEADITVTATQIVISFIELPEGGNDLELLVRSLI